MPRALIIQLARLGDLLQSFPAITALRNRDPHRPLDLLCPSPVAPLGRLFPGIEQALSWNGEDWHALSKDEDRPLDQTLPRAREYFSRYPSAPYSVAYNLNNHQRGILAAYLFSERVIGPGMSGVLSAESAPWSEYLRLVATYRGKNRVHIADALCGLCGVNPPADLPVLRTHDSELPKDLKGFKEASGVKVVLVVGAGDRDRCVPPGVWKEWITTFLKACPDGQVILVSGAGERELTHALLDLLPPLCLGRVWNAGGRTDFIQLVHLFSQCQWVIGSDTGPLHLGVACGLKAIGFYFSRARVHETGPYGEGHWVWQAEAEIPHQVKSQMQIEKRGVTPMSWPVRESIEVMLRETCSAIPEGWSLWQGHRDQRGMYFMEYDGSRAAPQVRDQIWQWLGHSGDVNWDVIKDLLIEPEPALRF